MSSTNTSNSLRSWSFSFAILSLFTLCFSSLVIGQTTFPGTGTGSIPDRGAAGCGLPAGPDLDISFAVSGEDAGPPSNVNVDFTATHTWVGDLEAKLIAPDGTEHILFSSTGSTTPTGCGSADDLGDTYAFDNTGTADWWALGNPYPGGTYQTTTAGDAAGGGAPTDINAAFAAIPDQNGTWILRINDSGGGDTGAVSAANLTLGGGVVPATQKFVDYDGDGTADYNVVRDATAALTGGSNPMFQAKSGRERMKLMSEMETTPTTNLGEDPGTNIDWYVNNSGSGTDAIAGFGQPATDFITPNDFDGDGQADLGVWRNSGADIGFFFVRSSDSTIVFDEFGQTNDNPAVVADYDGDGTDDPAVLRCPATAGQCTYFYRGSAGGGEITFVDWGNGTFFTIFPNTGDFDGDGMADFSVQRTNPDIAGAGQFVTLKSGGGVDFVNWGLNTDLILPGDYNGDGNSDYAVGRLESGNRIWYILDSDGATSLGTAQFGITGDFPTPADYDGDGSTDISVWRPDADPDNNYFYVFQSSDGAITAYEYGVTGDYPPANSKVQ